MKKHFRAKWWIQVFGVLSGIKLLLCQEPTINKFSILIAYFYQFINFEQGAKNMIKELICIPFWSVFWVSLILIMVTKTVFWWDFLVRPTQFWWWQIFVKIFLKHRKISGISDILFRYSSLSKTTWIWTYLINSKLLNVLLKKYLH